MNLDPVDQKEVEHALLPVITDTAFTLTVIVSVSRWPPTGLAGCRVRLVRAGSVHDRLSGHYLLDCDLEGCRDECDWVDLLK